MKKSGKYEVAIVIGDSVPVQAKEINLPFDEAIKKAKELWNSGEHYGVAVLDQTPNAEQPIQWFMSNSKFLENIPLADEE